MTENPATTVRLIEIGALGPRVSLAELGAAGGPAISYAVAEDLAPLPLTVPVFLNRADYASVFPDGPVARHGTIACSVRNCFMFSPFGFIVLADGTVIRQSVLQTDSGSMSFSFAQFKGQYPGGHVMWAAAEETVLSFNCYSTNNYFHFVMDALAQTHWRARLPAVERARMIVSGYTTEAAAAAPFIGQSLAAAGIDEVSLYPFDGTMMFCRHVVFPMRDTGANPMKIAALRRMLGLDKRRRGRDRLFITRADAVRRKLTNEAAVVALLNSHGFRSVDPGALTFREQVDLFAGAEIVVGPHGAGLTNAAFMAPGGAVVELTHTGRVVWTFHEVACASGHAYACVVGDMASGNAHPLFADFSVDVDAVDGAIRAVVAAIG
ncbi:MAG: glycosyltransferase family 61 protein [Rhodospirillaceae bacterium]|nr:MAG: glycosyltransferase family 61 protein [Rhodospirillaceae bacterium]